MDKDNEVGYIHLGKDIEHTSFICFLPITKQQMLKERLTKILGNDELEIAMNSRLCDLEEVLKIK